MPFGELYTVHCTHIVASTANIIIVSYLAFISAHAFFSLSKPSRISFTTCTIHIHSSMQLHSPVFNFRRLFKCEERPFICRLFSSGGWPALVPLCLLRHNFEIIFQFNFDMFPLSCFVLFCFVCLVCRFCCCCCSPTLFINELELLLPLSIFGSDWMQRGPCLCFDRNVPEYKCRTKDGQCRV